MTDAQLCELIRNSPETGNRALFDQYFNYVYAIVCRILGSCGTPEDVEECVADVFIDLWENPDKYDAGRGTLKSWLCMV